MTSTRKPEFKRTPAATLKANADTARQDTDNKVIVDWSYLTSCINSLDLSALENLHFSAKFLIDCLTAKVTKTQYEYDTIPIFKLETFDYIIYIHTHPQRFNVYDSEGYKQLYRYFYHDNMQIVVYSRRSDHAIFNAEFNKNRYQAFRTSINVNCTE